MGDCRSERSREGRARPGTPVLVDCAADPNEGRKVHCQREPAQSLLPSARARAAAAQDTEWRELYAKCRDGGGDAGDRGGAGFDGKAGDFGGAL